MCGIHALLIPAQPQPPPAHPPSHQPFPSDFLLPAETERCLRARGPDHLGQAHCFVPHHQPNSTGSTTTPNNPTEHPGWSLHFTSTVLALRGDHVARQPLQDSAADDGNGSDSVLCWNGEAWRFAATDADRDQAPPLLRPGENDGEVLFSRLNVAAAAASASSSSSSATSMSGDWGRDPRPVLDVLRAVEGPFAVVYYDAVGRRVFFARDRLGRRSLLLADVEGGGLALCSVAGEKEEGQRWREVEADGVYVVDLEERGARPVRYDWVVGENGDGDYVSGVGKFNRALPRSGECALTAGSSSVAALREQLLESLSLRITNIPIPPSSNDGGQTRVAVLFSGGLDCTVLARLAHEVLDPDQGVDLLNVAFENPRVVAQLQKERSAVADFYEACPDRITGRRSFAELQRVCPGRAFRFVAVNVPYAETLAHRQQVISLIYPHNTEMDLSIAYALYFAARGQGICAEASSSQDLSPVPYTSPARVLLSGLGADELFGGYSRHPAAFQQRGYAGLIDELLLDVGRLGKRNLGRDDRVMAHWGKEVRFPFLDERLVRWATETPAWEKCDFANDETTSGVEPGKRVLRLLALELGMESVAMEKKRAIQFGARTAKMESGRVKGTTLIS